VLDGTERCIADPDTDVVEHSRVRVAGAAVSPLHPRKESRKTRTKPWEMNSSRITV
jgi:hypothetical protein